MFFSLNFTVLPPVPFLLLVLLLVVLFTPVFQIYPLASCLTLRLFLIPSSLNFILLPRVPLFKSYPFCFVFLLRCSPHSSFVCFSSLSFSVILSLLVLLSASSSFPLSKLYPPAACSSPLDFILVLHVPSPPFVLLFVFFFPPPSFSVFLFLHVPFLLLVSHFVFSSPSFINFILFLHVPCLLLVSLRLFLSPTLNYILLPHVPL